MEKHKMGKHNLAIRDNSAATNDPCAICGQRTDPVVGPELFMADSDRLVCYECGRKYAPDLVAALHAYRATIPATFPPTIPAGVAEWCKGNGYEIIWADELQELVLGDYKALRRIEYLENGLRELLGDTKEEDTLPEAKDGLPF